MLYYMHVQGTTHYASTRNKLLCILLPVVACHYQGCCICCIIYAATSVAVYRTMTTQDVLIIMY